MKIIGSGEIEEVTKGKVYRIRPVSYTHLVHAVLVVHLEQHEHECKPVICSHALLLSLIHI